MKKSSIIAITVFMIFAAAAALPDKSSSGNLKNTSEPQIKLLPKTEPRQAKRKTKRKKAAPKPVSEYKFGRIDHKPAYKFDKKTNPIVKKPKPKKSAAKKARPVKNKAPAKKAAAAPRTKPADGAEQDDGKLKFYGENTQPPPQDQPEE